MRQRAPWRHWRPTPLRFSPAQNSAARGCANWLGNWRNRVPTSTSRPRCSTSPRPGPLSGLSPGSRCCTWSTRERTGSKLVIKSLLDRTAAAIALTLLAPIFAAIAIRIRIEDGGPVFFKQIRVGRNGQPFKVWKFRTMVINAERLQANLTEQNEGNGALFKMRRDPRITKPGTWLRRYSLDELPQLINVARGEMSIVGPRPALPEETAKYNGTHMTRRIVVKPGITGLWQVSGRSDLSLADSMRLDVHYVENWSLVLDLQILWKTAWAVLGGGGAY